MKLKTLATVGVSWLALAGAAAAQEAPQTQADRDAAIQALQQRLSELEAQLEDLKASSAADVAEVRRVASEQPVVTIANGRPTIASSDGNFTASLRGLVQFDAASYFDDGDNAGGATGDLNSGTNFRRVRLGLEGTIAHDWNYNITAEYGGSYVESTQLNQAWVEYAGWRPWGTQVRLRAGAWATPVNLEDATNNTEALFLERASPAEIVRSIAAGDGRTGIGAFANGERWYASAVYTGERIGQGSAAGSNPNSDEQSGYILRAAFLPLRSPDYALHLGVNATGVLEVTDLNSGSGFTGKTVTLSDYPELRVSSQQFASAALGATVDTIDQYGAEVGGYWKNFYLAGEYTNISVERTGANTDPEFDGWYVQGAWTLTGERRAWNAANGGFQGIRPANAFSPADGHWGAWEIAARYSDLNLNDPSAGINGGEQTITSLGLNWYPHRSVRFLLDAQDVEVDYPGSANDVAYQALALRSQVAF